ncbi:NuoF family protein [Vulcanococcus limneticus]|uniref:NuoF family protein n=1 Tax=Vulcanococcus limneticus TaxID=2170428 RepID=UPI000B99315A|nr:NADH-ubiquinone oxidoreductase-F iron-sulfur binding region domain-containing protein [Vulcanococcus limneticus]MCP9792156.1 SLBB domain-containing protein [Vulcanococcus limneticus MW73D5]MCP9893950.1 SLBB domain-containing protein [Vulcanococcus limneticus Candia 3F8]MCP9897542.1 SLBB domain-containing protein [Vulcanococcus limneticus Candia 3B3]
MSGILRVCTAAGCAGCGGSALREQLGAVIAAATTGDPASGLALKGVGCLGPCGEGALLELESASGRRLFGGITPEGVAAVAASLANLSPGTDLGTWAPPAARPIDLEQPFFRLQKRLVLEHCGRIDPESLAEALAAGSYGQLRRVLQENRPEAVIEQVRRSGLRGRGGGGYPTGLKWATVARMPGPEKVVVCNADEGDPGAFMDRSVLEGDPHRLLEGMAIAAWAVGASRGFIYVRAEYPMAIAHLRTAIAQAEDQGLLGAAIAGSAFGFQLELRVGAGAFVCGEETALIHSIEGQRGVPRPRPPYPAEVGVFGLPTLINNVETFASVPPLLAIGAEAYAAIGTTNSGGTKVFSLTGDVRLAGVLEVPMGTPIATIVETMGGGAPDGHAIKAVQTGGPSGGCVPANRLDTPVDYESLQELGSIMGSGGMVVMDDSTSMVDVACFFMAFCREESCGKCIPCRSGTVQLHLLLQKHLAGEADAADLAQLESLCHMVKDTSLCGLGQSAPKPVLSTLRHFRGDYLALLRPEPEATPEPVP